MTSPVSRHHMLRAAIVAVAFFSAPLFASEATWEKLHERDGVETYSMPPAADGFVSFKGVATIDAGIDDVAAAMSDNTTASSWMPMVGERHDLRVFSPTHRIEYTHMKMPWPAKDRYYISEAKVATQPDGSVVLSVASVSQPETAWLKPKMIMATFRHSEFRLSREADGKTKLVFEVRTSAGGSLPSWLVRMGQQSWPRDFVVGLHGELSRRGKLAQRVAENAVK